MNMRDEVIEILEMICPDIDVNDEDMNLPEDLDSNNNGRKNRRKL